MPESDSQLKVEPAARNDAPDPLAGLYHMSTTAGAGTQDYVAINPVAIWAAFFGVASVLAVMSNVLLAIPLVGLVCSIVALVQIRSSNGTQTGTGLGIIGLVLALVLGGGKLGYELIVQTRVSADEAEIDRQLHQIGEQVIQGKYDAAYARFDDTFRSRVGPAEFAHTMEAVTHTPGAGQFTGIEWNRQPIDLIERPDTGIVDAYVMAYLNYSASAEPRRTIMEFKKSNGIWRPEAIESLFPTPTKKSEKQ
jgi:hypothetical protein